MTEADTNEQTFKKYIAEQNGKALTVEWVNWMLDVLLHANVVGHRLNPEWLRAPGRTISARPQIEEPPMIYK